jgi:RNA polymerase sigma-70 factor (ECF subfamily)
LRGVATDFELLSAWRDGEREAGDALVERYFDPICRFFRSKVGPNLTEVEDLIQRTFLDCAESVDRIEASSFKAYLFAVARNRLYDHLRRTHRRPIAELSATSIADLGTTPSQAVARNQEQALVIEALKTLPLDFQITLELKYWEQLSDPEIAEVLGVAPNTVRSRLARGRNLLKEALGEKNSA